MWILLSFRPLKRLRRTGPFVVTALAVFLLLAACQAGGGVLKPIRPVPTPIGLIEDRPTPVDFPELNENPAAYRDTLIRVTGIYTRLPLPDCARTSGPQLEWALISGNLRLDARGFEQVLRLLPGGMTLTLDGFWRLYEGPLGCGKEGPVGAAWYLETIQIVQPNPLTGFFEAGVVPEFEQPPAPLAPTPDPNSTAEPGLEITIIPPTATIGLTPSPIGIPTGTPTRTVTPAGTPTTTVTPTASGTPGPTVTGTPPTPTPTPSPSPTVQPGPTQPGGPPPTSIPPSTPPGYPGPGEGTPPSYP